MQCKIQASYNSIMKSSPYATRSKWGQEHGVSIDARFSYINRNNKRVELSGYRVGDKYIMRPLFSCHGRKRFELSAQEYNDMVQGAEVDIWHTSNEPGDFVSFVAENEQRIKDIAKLA